MSPLKAWLCEHAANSSLDRFVKWQEAGMKDPLIFSSETPMRKFIAYIDPENKFAVEDKLSQINTLEQCRLNLESQMNGRWTCAFASVQFELNGYYLFVFQYRMLHHMDSLKNVLRRTICTYMPYGLTSIRVIFTTLAAARSGSYILTKKMWRE